MPLQVCPGLTSDPIQGRSQIQSHSTHVPITGTVPGGTISPHLALLAWWSRCPSLQAARAGSGEGAREDGDGQSCSPILWALDWALVSRHCLHVNMDGGSLGSPVWHLLLGRDKAQPALEGSSYCAVMAVGCLGMCSGQNGSGSTTAVDVAMMLRRGMRWDPMGNVYCQTLGTLSQRDPAPSSAPCWALPSSLSPHLYTFSSLSGGGPYPSNGGHCGGWGQVWQPPTPCRFPVSPESQAGEGVACPKPEGLPGC